MNDLTEWQLAAESKLHKERFRQERNDKLTAIAAAAFLGIVIGVAQVANDKRVSAIYPSTSNTTLSSISLR